MYLTSLRPLVRLDVATLPELKIANTPGFEPAVAGDGPVGLLGALELRHYIARSTAHIRLAKAGMAGPFKNRALVQALTAWISRFRGLDRPPRASSEARKLVMAVT
jgi:hypothetical protein